MDGSTQESDRRIAACCDFDEQRGEEEADRKVQEQRVEVGCEVEPAVRTEGFGVLCGADHAMTCRIGVAPSTPTSF